MIARAAALALSLLVVGSDVQAQSPQGWRTSTYDSRGPEPFLSDPGGNSCTIFRPANLGSTKHPIVIWGNGSGAIPVHYIGILQDLASWGFVVAAANTPQAGSGREMLGCLDWLTAENAREGSVFKDRLDLTRVGASGHSQGGGGALMAGADPRIKATAPIMPSLRNPTYRSQALASQHGPMLLLSGVGDTITPPAIDQKPVFELVNQPVVWATLAGAGHMAPMRDGAVYPGIVTAWFRYQLMDDSRAGIMFKGETCGYCTTGDWTIQRKAAP